jgi:cytochrome c
VSRLAIPLVAGLALIGAPATVAAADGARAFAMQCASCHGAKSTRAGPSLAGIAGAPIAARGDFTYSSGLRAKAKERWSEANLDAYLKAPASFAPGTSMFVAVPSPQTRAALVAHLKTLIQEGP